MSADLYIMHWGKVIRFYPNARHNGYMYDKPTEFFLKPGEKPFRRLPDMTDPARVPLPRGGGKTTPVPPVYDENGRILSLFERVCGRDD